MNTLKKQCLLAIRQVLPCLGLGATSGKGRQNRMAAATKVYNDQNSGTKHNAPWLIAI